MKEEPTGRFVPLLKVGDVAKARIVAARLEAEGIEVRLHSEALGPYPVTVGQMATTELWVLDDRIEDARTIVLDTEVNEVLGGSDMDVGRPIPEIRFVAVVLIVIVLAVVILRLMRVF